MNSSDEGGSKLRQLSQSEILQLVEDGQFAPEHAEKWAKDHHYPPFAPGPIDSPAGSVIDHQWWTLPMAAAWFTWRSRLAVHHQSKSARIRWKRWVIVQPASDPFAPRKKCRLADFGQPETWDVFSEAMQDPRIPLLQRIVRTQSSPSLSDLKADLPYGRLKKALQSGILRAIRVTKAPRNLVAPAYWRANFDAHAGGPATSRSALKASICFRQSDVVRAETLVARGEFDRPVVGPEQAVGWLAYRDVDSFRSLARSDLRGKRYYGASYEKDYVNLQPEKELFVALVEGKIKGYREGVVLTQRMRMRLKSIWELSDLEFFRRDLIEVWQPLPVNSFSTNVILPISKEASDLSPSDKKIEPLKERRNGPVPEKPRKRFSQLKRC
jgi:hypothetical protein